MAKIPLTEVFNITTMSLLDSYHNVICDTVIQQLEDTTTWLLEDQLPNLTDPGFGMYHARNRNSAISLQKPAIQQLIFQHLKDCQRPSSFVRVVPVLICFLIPDGDIPKPPSSSVASDSAHQSRSRRYRQGPPSLRPSQLTSQPIVLITPEEVPTPTTQRGKDAFVDELEAEAPHFWKQPVDTRPIGGHGPPAVAGRFHSRGPSPPP